MWDGEQWTARTRTDSAAGKPVAPPPPPTPIGDARIDARRPRATSGWSVGSMAGVGVGIFALLMVGGCALFLGVAPLLAVRSDSFSEETEIAVAVPDQPDFAVETTVAMPPPGFETLTTLGPGMPGFELEGILTAYNTPVEVPIDGGADLSLFEITVGEPVDITEELVAANPLNAEPLPGIIHVAVPVTAGLIQSPVDPVAMAGLFDWQMVGGSTATLYRPAEPGTDQLGCTVDDDWSTVTELTVGESRTATVCVTLPVVDFDHPDTRVVLDAGFAGPYLWGRS